MSKLKILWINAIGWNGNAHSFLNYNMLEQFIEDFEFIYHPIIYSEYNLEQIVNDDIDCDILMIEGAISKNFKRADKSIVDIVTKYGVLVKKIVTIGTCAAFGGIFRDSSYANTTGLHFDGKKTIDIFSFLKDKTICVSGCPIHPEILANTLYSIKNDLDAKLDEFLRIKEFYSYSIHNGCTRNEYFEYKVDNHKFGKKEGCMFYEHGCKGPFTHGSCNKILWNGVNSKTRSGQPCMGCTEPDLFKSNLYKTKTNMGIPQNLPLGINKRAYLSIASVSKSFKIKRLENDLF